MKERSIPRRVWRDVEVPIEIPDERPSRWEGLISGLILFGFMLFSLFLLGAISSFTMRAVAWLFSR